MSDVWSTRLFTALMLAGLLIGGCGTRIGAAQVPVFTTVRDVPLRGGSSRFDYQSLDGDAHRLYIAHLGAGFITVFDTASGNVVGDILDVPGAHGVLAVPELGRVFATATDANQVVVIDPSALTVVASIPGGSYPDGLAYAPEFGKLYVSDENGKTDTVIDVPSNRVVATIPLGGEAGNTQYDPVSHQIFVAVHSGQVVVIDPTTDRVSGHADVPGCRQPHGLLIDPARRLAYIGCEGNAKMAVMDMTSMQVASTFDVGRGPDVLAFDAALRRLFVAAEDGPLTVFASDENGVRKVAQEVVGPNAHSVIVDPTTHHLYLPLADVSGQPVLREVQLDLQEDGDGRGSGAQTP